MARARAISPRAAVAAAHALALGLVLALALALGAACVAARQADYARIDEDAFAAEEAAFFHARTLRQEYAAYPKAAADPSRALLAGADDAEVTRRIGKGFMDRGSISSYVKAGGPAFNYALQRTGSNLFQTLFSAHTGIEMYNAEKPTAPIPFYWRSPLGEAHVNHPGWKHFRITETPWLEAGGNRRERRNLTNDVLKYRPKVVPGGPTNLDDLEAYAQFALCRGKMLEYALCSHGKFSHPIKFYLVSVKSPARWLYSVMRNCPDCPQYAADDDNGLGAAMFRGKRVGGVHGRNPAQQRPARYVQLWNDFYGRWLDLARSNPGRVAIVRYEDIIANCRGAIETAARKVGVKFTPTDGLPATHKGQGCHGDAGPSGAIFMSGGRDFKRESEKYLGWSWMNEMDKRGVEELAKHVDRELMDALGYNSTELDENIARKLGRAVADAAATEASGVPVAHDRIPATFAHHNTQSGPIASMRQRFQAQRG